MFSVSAILFLIFFFFLNDDFLLLPLTRFPCFHHRLMAGNESVNANVLILLLKTPFACPDLDTYKTI